MFPPARTQSRDFASATLRNSSSPSLETQNSRSTAGSGRSKSTLTKIKSLGGRLKVWRRTSKGGDADSLMSDTSAGRERKSWHQQALQHLAAFDSPNPFFHVVWIY